MTPKWKTAGTYSDILYQKAGGIRVLELRADRKRDAAWRKEAFASVAR